MKISKEIRAKLRAEQQRAFDKTRARWREEVMADATIGGMKFRTAMLAIAQVSDTFVSPRQRKKFDNFLRDTGAGDHPEMLRLFYRIGQAMNPRPIAPRRRRRAK